MNQSGVRPLKLSMWRLWNPCVASMLGLTFLVQPERQAGDDKAVQGCQQGCQVLVSDLATAPQLHGAQCTDVNTIPQYSGQNEWHPGHTS